MHHRALKGFTLIKLSIVLVIIGLIVGGVLVGQDLIRAAEVRKAVSQIEKTNTALNTFFTKYNMVPGDATPAQAGMFGLVSRVCGKNDGYIGSFFVNEGSAINLDDLSDFSGCGPSDESEHFFLDLVSANLMNFGLTLSPPGPQNLEKYLPELGVDQAYIVAGNGGPISTVPRSPFGYTLIGYIKGQTQMSAWNTQFAPLSQSTAFALDSKMDDGNALTGIVYTLDMLPGSGSMPNIGVYNSCSDGNGVYDIVNDAPNSCLVKIRAGLP